MKFLVLTVAIALVIWWWLERRRTVVRHALRGANGGSTPSSSSIWREPPPALGSTPLFRCRTCGAYAVKDGGACDRRDCPRA